MPLQFLKTDTRNIESRHRSLWDTIAWSYALLEADEQRFFRHLAVFVDSCTAEAVAAICCDPKDTAHDVLDQLTALVDKNLLQVTQGDGGLRFTMLETIREFGLAQLAACQELAPLQGRHARYFAQVVNAQAQHLMSSASTAAKLQIQAVYPNVRIALQWLLTQREIDACLCLCNDLLHFWTLIELYKEAETYIQAALQLAADTPPSPAYVNALAAAGFVAFSLGQSALAIRSFEQCLAMNDEIDNLGNPKWIGMANGILAWLCFDQGDYQAAQRYFATAQANDIATGDEWALAMTLANRGKMAALLGEFDQAEALLQEALLRHRRIGQAWGIAGVLTRQGHLYTLQGKFTAAARVLAESVALSLEKGLSKPNYYLGLVALETGEYVEASALLQAELRQEQGDCAPRYLLPMLEAVVRLAVKQNHCLPALTLAGAGCALRRQLKLVMPPVAKQPFDEAVAVARQHLCEEAAATAWAKGEAMTLDEAVIYALAAVA